MKKNAERPRLFNSGTLAKQVLHVHIGHHQMLKHARWVEMNLEPNKNKILGDEGRFGL